METSYFAAQTMQNKVRYSFDELPENVHKVSFVVISVLSPILAHGCK